MRFLRDMFGKKNSAKTAKERLIVTLNYERNDLPPDFPQRIQNDLREVFSKYPQFDAQNLEVELIEEGNLINLKISIPLIYQSRYQSRRR